MDERESGSTERLQKQSRNWLANKNMMNTLALNYCAVCEAVSQMTRNFFARLIETCETVGRARAVAELHRQGSS